MFAMARPISVVAEEVASRAKGLRDYAHRMEGLHRSRDISLSDLHRVYAGAFLSFHTYLERSIERAFLGLLVRQFESTDRNVRPLVDINSNKVAHDVIRGVRPFAEWLPYDQYTVKRADAFFSGGRPFTNLTNAQVNVFARTTIVRNAIAHESSYALRRFGKSFTDHRALPPEQRKPAGYLRGQHAVGQSRLDFMLSEAVNSMRALCR
jgi:hypothetical protein